MRRTIRDARNQALTSQNPFEQCRKWKSNFPDASEISSTAWTRCGTGPKRKFQTRTCQDHIMRRKSQSSSNSSNSTKNRSGSCRARRETNRIGKIHKWSKRSQISKSNASRGQNRRGSCREQIAMSQIEQSRRGTRMTHNDQSCDSSCWSRCAWNQER